VVSDCSSANSDIALAEAAVVAGRGGSYPHRLTLSVSLYLYLILWCYRRPLGFGLSNFQQKLMWHARVLTFCNSECGWSKEFGLLQTRTLLILEMGLKA